MTNEKKSVENRGYEPVHRPRVLHVACGSWPACLAGAADWQALHRLMYATFHGVLSLILFSTTVSGQREHCQKPRASAHQHLLFACQRAAEATHRDDQWVIRYQT
jgi:hypothetical protein